jgi:hypothetical protein
MTRPVRRFRYPILYSADVPAGKLWMRHLVGYLICLGFVVLALTYMGLYDTVYAHSDRVQATVVATLETDPLVGRAVQGAVHLWTSALAPNPLATPITSVVGRVATVALSPVGAIALGLYWFILWLFPS